LYILQYQQKIKFVWKKPILGLHAVCNILHYYKFLQKQSRFGSGVAVLDINLDGVLDLAVGSPAYYIDSPLEYKVCIRSWDIYQNIYICTILFFIAIIVYQLKYRIHRSFLFKGDRAKLMLVMVCFYLKITWNVTVFMIYIKVIHSNLIHQNIWNSEKWYNIFTNLIQPESGFALLKGALPICGNKCWRLELSTNLKSKKCTKHWYDDD
jgi:hypothetical protein